MNIENWKQRARREARYYDPIVTWVACLLFAGALIGAMVVLSYFPSPCS